MTCVIQSERPQPVFAWWVGVSIDTPDLLREVAETSGLFDDECIELDTYQRYDMHQQNSIRREVLLLLRTR